MKNLFKSIMMVAVAAISFTSCSNNFTEEIVTGEKIQFNVSAVNEEVTRSAFGVPSEGTYPTLWSGDEGFALNINGADGETTSVVEATFSGDKRAVNLSANIEFETAPETYTLYAIAPATAYVSVQPSGWQVTIPTSQTTGTLSCDPAAQILVGASETKASASETFDMTFKHAVAYGKMTLKNLALDDNDATISSVAITSTKNIANRFYINQATREYSENSGAKTITVNTTSAENIWFALAPVDVSSTELKIVVNTDKGTFTKTVNMPENRKFELGKISTFNVDMNGIELVGPVEYTLLTDASNLKVGDKVVIAAADDNYAISATQNNNNRGQAAITKSDDKKTISDPGDGVEIFTVQEGKKSDTYAFKATKTEGYIYAASSTANQLRTKATLDDNGSWTVTVDANGVATITAQGTNTRNWLRYNTSSGLFNCYSATSNQADVVIYHMEGDGDVELTPSITAENISGVAAEGVTDATTTFTSENLTEAITVTCDGIVVTAASVSGNVLTYTVDVNSGEAREGWIKLAANGVEKTITVSQLAPISGDTATGTISFNSTAHRVSQDGNSQVWKNDNITFTNDKAASSNAVVGNTNPVRLYAGSSITITAPGKITQIEFACDNSTYATALKNSVGSAATASGSNVTVSLNGTSETFTVASLTAQVRLDSLTVTYIVSGDVVVKESQTLTFNLTEIEATVGEDVTEPTLSGAMTTVTYSSSNEAVATVNSETGAVTLVGAGTTTITATAEETDVYYEAFANYTLTVKSAPIVTDGAYTLLTDISELVAGDKIVIAAKDYSYALSTTQNSNNRGQAEITKDDDIITFGDDVQILTVETGTKSGTYAFNTGSGYLFAASSGSNYLRTETDLSDNSSWKITIADGTATIVAQGTYTRNTMQYNNSSKIFACYSSASQKPLVIYRLKK